MNGDFEQAAACSLRDFTEMTSTGVAAGMSKDALQKAAAGTNALARWAMTVDASTVQRSLGACVVDTLHDDMQGIFAGVWTKSVELRQVAADSLNNRESERVALTAHEFSYGVDPVVEVVVDHVNVGHLSFSVKMVCAVEGLVLVLTKGCVSAVEAGKCSGSASILLAGEELWKNTFMHADLPGVLRIKQPIPLARPQGN